MKSAFESEGVKVRFTTGMEGFCGGKKDMEQWIRPKVQECVKIIETLGKFVVRYPQTAYDRVSMSLQVEWQ